jgi:hypothetical protein
MNGYTRNKWLLKDAKYGYLFEKIVNAKLTKRKSEGKEKKR